MLREGVINVYILQLSSNNKNCCVVTLILSLALLSKVVCYSVTCTVKCHSHYDTMFDFNFNTIVVYNTVRVL